MRRAGQNLAVIGLCMGLAGPTGAVAATWDEATDGDLSTDENAPTSLSFELGGNGVSGSVLPPEDARDYLTFTIGEGQQLEAIELVYLEDDEGGPGNTIYHAIIEGSTSLIPGPGTAGDFLGGAHLTGLDVGTDVLADLAAAEANGTGFETPLGPGTYTYLLQQASGVRSNYGLSFVVGVPEPTAASLLVTFLVMVAMGPLRRSA